MSRCLLRRIVLLLLVSLVPWLLPSGPALAQGPSVHTLAIEWARGSYGSPLLCEIDGRPVRGLRRIQITPGPRHARPPTTRIIFVRLKAEGATRCFTDLAPEVPNYWGQLELRVTAKPRPETLLREFQQRVTQPEGLEYDVVSSTLQQRAVGPEAGLAERIRLRGARAWLRPVLPGSDAARLLGDLPGPVRLELVIRPEKGDELRWPLVRTAER